MEDRTVKKILRFARIITIAAAASLVVALLSTPTPPETPEDVVSALSAAGLEYEGKWIGPDVGVHYGFHVKPKGDLRPWSDLANADSVPGSKRHIIFIPIHGTSPSSHPTVGSYYLIGDEDEIRIILSSVR